MKKLYIIPTGKTQDIATKDEQGNLKILKVKTEVDQYGEEYFTMVNLLEAMEEDEN